MYIELFCARNKIDKPNEIKTNHNEAKMVKDGEDLRGLQTTSLKNLT